MHSGLYMLYTVPLGPVPRGRARRPSTHRRLKGIKIFQTVFSSTVATSVAVASVVFYTLVNPEIGYFKDVPWLSLRDGTSALFAVSLTSVWQNLGLTFIVVLAALQAVPDEMIEAATLDGYGAVRRFFRITVPLISPALLFLAIVLVVTSLQAYAQIEILTGGGPGGATETLLFKIADPRGVRSLGERASLSLGLFVLTAAVAGVPVLPDVEAGDLWRLNRSTPTGLDRPGRHHRRRAGLRRTVPHAPVCAPRCPRSSRTCC